MNVKCSAYAGGKLKDGFLVQTWSGTDSQQICAVRGEPSIRHYVQVINQSLSLTPKRAKGECKISASDSVIRFVSENSTDTPTFWQFDVFLPGGKGKTFSRALEVIEDAVGIEKISIAGEWISPTETKPFSLKIDVST